METDAQVFHGCAWDRRKLDFVICVGLGTPEALAKRGLKARGPALYHPHQMLQEGWFPLLHAAPPYSAL